MAKLPTDLKQKWWSDHKPLTLKPTGLGKGLKAVEDATKRFDGLKSHSDAEFQKLFAAFNDLLELRN